MAWSNDALSDDNDDSRLLMPAGMFFVVMLTRYSVYPHIMFV